MSFNITNLVVQAQLNVTIDLSTLIHKISDARYNPKNFSAIIWNHRKIGKNLLLFSNGKCVCNGCLSFTEARKAVRQYARLLQKLGYSVKLQCIQPVTITGLADIGLKLDLPHISRCYSSSTLELELFNGLMIKNGKVHFTVFTSGRVVIAGIKNRSDMLDTVFPNLAYIYKAQKAFNDLRTII